VPHAASVVRLKFELLICMLSSCRFLRRRWRCLARIARSLTGWPAPGVGAWRSARGSHRRARARATGDPKDVPGAGLPGRERGSSVAAWGRGRARFSRHGPGGLADSARPGRRKAGLVLTDAERDQLQRWARRAKTSQVLARRAKIVLACAEGAESKKVAAGL